MPFSCMVCGFKRPIDLQARLNQSYHIWALWAWLAGLNQAAWRFMVLHGNDHACRRNESHAPQSSSRNGQSMCKIECLWWWMRSECDNELIIRHVRAFNIHSTCTRVFHNANQGLIYGISFVYLAISSVVGSGCVILVTYLTIGRSEDELSRPEADIFGCGRRSQNLLKSQRPLYCHTCSNANVPAKAGTIWSLYRSCNTIRTAESQLYITLMIKNVFVT